MQAAGIQPLPVISSFSVPSEAAPDIDASQESWRFAFVSFVAHCCFQEVLSKDKRIRSLLSHFSVSVATNSRRMYHKVRLLVWLGKDVEPKVRVFNVTKVALF